MILTQPVLARIATGEIDLVFRRWRRPTVKTGGTLKTAIGVLAIEALDAVDSFTSDEARRAGYASAADLERELAPYAEHPLYRIRVRLAGADPRIELRDRLTFAPAESARLTKLNDLDHRILDLIVRNPATRAGDLAPQVGMETLVFKTRVRRLKNLGLTESLGTGYRISPRGSAYIALAAKRSAPASSDA